LDPNPKSVQREGDQNVECRVEPCHIDTNHFDGCDTQDFLAVLIRVRVVCHGKQVEEEYDGITKVDETTSDDGLNRPFSRYFDEFIHGGEDLEVLACRAECYGCRTGKDCTNMLFVFGVVVVGHRGIACPQRSLRHLLDNFWVVRGIGTRNLFYCTVVEGSDTSLTHEVYSTSSRKFYRCYGSLVSPDTHPLCQCQHWCVEYFMCGYDKVGLLTTDKSGHAILWIDNTCIHQRQH
jgi:hypothetical protein